MADNPLPSRRLRLNVNVTPDGDGEAVEMYGDFGDRSENKRPVHLDRPFFHYIEQ